jgi:hypothetical protein
VVTVVTGAPPVSGSQPELSGFGTLTAGGRAPCRVLTSARRGTPCRHCVTRAVWATAATSPTAQTPSSRGESMSHCLHSRDVLQACGWEVPGSNPDQDNNLPGLDFRFSEQ